MNDLIVITGQTATGKTKLALDYAARLDGELINADSRHFYNHLDIVTGKDREELDNSGIKVHLLDIITPDKSFSAYDFVRLAVPIIQDIWKRKKTPILVGGSYLYIKHLLYGQDVKVPPNQKLRSKLEKLSVEVLQKKLRSLDKTVYSKLNNSDLHNPRRLIRKIEILHGSIRSVKSVKSIKSTTSGKGYGLPFGFVYAEGRSAQGEQAMASTSSPQAGYKIFGLKHKTKESLISLITKRVEKRLKQGALNEVKTLLKLGYKENDEGLQTIGYKQLISHLNGDMTLEQAKQDWINKEVQYAKRQYTFMKLDENIHWQDA